MIIAPTPQRGTSLSLCHMRVVARPEATTRWLLEAVLAYDSPYYSYNLRIFKRDCKLVAAAAGRARIFTLGTLYAEVVVDLKWKEFMVFFLDRAKLS